MVGIKQEAPLEPLNLEHFVLPLIMLATGLRNITNIPPFLLYVYCKIGFNHRVGRASNRLYRVGMIVGKILLGLLTSLLSLQFWITINNSKQ